MLESGHSWPNLRRRQRQTRGAVRVMGVQLPATTVERLAEGLVFYCALLFLGPHKLLHRLNGRGQVFQWAGRGRCQLDWDLTVSDRWWLTPNPSIGILLVVLHRWPLGPNWPLSMCFQFKKKTIRHMSDKRIRFHSIKTIDPISRVTIFKSYRRVFSEKKPFLRVSFNRDHKTINHRV